MGALLSFVVQATVYGTVVGAVIFILKSTILKRLSAKWQYMLWLVMIVKLIFPKGPESNISIFNKINISQAVNNTKLLNVAETAEPAVKAAESSTGIFTAIWLAVSIAMAVWLFISFCVLKYKINTSSAQASPKTLEALEKCKEITGVKRNIKAVVQNHVPTTALWGLFTPKILITPDFEKAEAVYIEYTFIHELSHYKRRDIAMNYLILILQCIHWFNPVIWFLFKKLRRDIELATDEAAMLCIEPAEHKDYGMALINTLSAAYGRMPALLGMASNKRDIKKRIRAVAKFKKPSLAQLVMGIITVMVVASACLTSAVIAKPISRLITHNLLGITTEISYADFFKPEKEPAPLPEQKEESAEEEPKEVQEPAPEPVVDHVQAVVEYTPAISYNSDSEESQSITYKTDGSGEISFMVTTKSVHNHELAINVYNVKTPEQSWDFRINTSQYNYYVPEQFEPNEEYVITVNAYCPGHYGIEGTLYVY